jgi:type II secretory pathway component PulF
MANFNYSAVNKRGETVKGSLEATDRSVVVKGLMNQGLKPLSVKETAAAKSIFSFNLFGGKVKNDQIVVFTRELSAMVGAGVPLLRALTSLHDHTESSTLKNVLNSVIKDIEGGSSLGNALAKFHTTFNDVYVNMVRAGEAAGILDEILNRLAYQQEKNATFRKKIKSAMTYPTVLVCIAVLAFFGLTMFVIPQIGKILTDLGGPDAKLPFITLVKVYESALQAAATEVKNGATLSSVIEKNPLFPAIVPQMLAVGEETGQTDTVLVKVADFYEQEVDVAIEGVSSIIEPVMIVFMGGMVGLIAASVMLPIASLSQNIK